MQKVGHLKTEKENLNLKCDTAKLLNLRKEKFIRLMKSVNQTNTTSTCNKKGLSSFRIFAVPSLKYFYFFVHLVKER